MTFTISLRELEIIREQYQKVFHERFMNTIQEGQELLLADPMMPQRVDAKTVLYNRLAKKFPEPTMEDILKALARE